MRKKLNNHTAKPAVRHFTSRISLLLLATLSHLSFQSGAQTSRTYSHQGYSFKNYSLTQEGTAGTIYNPPGGVVKSSVHYMWLSPQGDVQNSVYYDNGNGEDDRFVDLSTMVNGMQLITSATFDPATKKHFIRLINAQPDGTFIQAVDLKMNNAAYADIYPMSTLVEGDTIFICGYIRESAGGVSNYHTGKSAFILSYVPASGTVNAISFGYSSTNFFYTNPSNPNEYYYFNMALRMKMLNTAGGKYLAVTGSDYSYHPVPGLPPSALLSTAVGATMLATFNPADMLSNYHTTFTSSNASANSDIYEYGMGIHYDGSNKLYILGNYAHAYDGPDGFNTQPIQPWVQAVDFPYLTPSGGGTTNDRTVFQTDAAWGLQMEPDQGSPGTLTIAGLQMKPVTGCTYTNSAPPNGDNVNPFLLNIATSYGSSGINTVETDWVTLPSIIGTGAGPDSYIKLDRGSNTMAWAPNPMMQDGSIPYKIMAPIEGAGTTLLNSKLIAADNTRKIMDCEGLSTTCYTAMTPDIAILSDVPTTRFFHYAFDVDVTAVQLKEIPLGMTEIACDRYQHRPATTGTAALEPASTPAIYPNPASDYISLPPATYGASDNAEIILADITGKVIGLLYSGAANAVPARLSLPSVVNGMYLVDVRINGNSTRKEKISILH